ncbi:MAG: alpha/beta hydrolase [Gammaproteobacteria bacterium]|nr:alpha/beta hydrolase [Gammaproteobacteria bacterium]
MKTGVCDIQTSRLSYRLYGDESNPLVIVETALANCSAEWWHLAEVWSKKFCVLLYDRAGYGSSSTSTLLRTPMNIAKELGELLNALEISKKAVLIGHSMGGLYAQQFARLFPGRIHALILLDPVSANSHILQQQLSDKEYDQSGIDKGRNLRLGWLISSLRLGFLFKPLLRKAPPFYYYDNFTKEAEDCILNHLTQRKMYRSALSEYQCLTPDSTGTASLGEKGDFPNVPIYLICHDPEIMIAEIVAYGGANIVTAAKIDHLWISLMKEYLSFSEKAQYRQAHKSGHFIHLSDPNILWETLLSIKY